LNEAVLERFFREEEWVFRLARRLVRDEQSAKDLVQDTWVAVLSKRPQTASNPRAWLSVAVHNIVNRQREKLRPFLIDGLDRQVAKGEHPEQAAERWEGKRLLAAAIAELARQDREIILCRWQEEMSYAQIADHFGIAERTVGFRLSAALDRLRHGLRARSENGDWMAALGPLVVALRPGRYRWVGIAGAVAVVTACVVPVGYLSSRPSPSDLRPSATIPATHESSSPDRVDLEAFRAPSSRRDPRTAATPDVALPSGPLAPAPQDARMAVSRADEPCRLSGELSLGGTTTLTGWRALLCPADGRTPAIEGRVEGETGHFAVSTMEAGLHTLTLASGGSFVLRETINVPRGETRWTFETRTGSVVLSGTCAAKIYAYWTDGIREVTVFAAEEEGVRRFDNVPEGDVSMRMWWRGCGKQVAGWPELVAGYVKAGQETRLVIPAHDGCPLGGGGRR